MGERLSVSQRIINRLLMLFKETGIPAEQHPDYGHCTTAIQDQYLTLTTRRLPFLIPPNVILIRNTIRNIFHEANLEDQRDTHILLEARLEWCVDFQMIGNSFMHPRITIVQILVKLGIGEDLEI